MAEEIPTFESMFRKSKGLDLAEEAPSEEEFTLSEKQRDRAYDKLTDENGDSRLKYKANVPALENFEQDIRAPQGEVHDADKLKATRKSAGFREMVARKCFEKTGRIPDVEFMDTYEVKKAAVETDINDLQGAASTDPIRGYRGENMGEMVDDFENSPHFANERKKIADRVNSISPEKLDPGYEKMIGTTGYLETPGDVGASLAESVEQDAISDDDTPQAYLDFMSGPHSKAIVGKMKSHGFSDEEIQSTLRQILEGYNNPRDYQDY